MYKNTFYNQKINYLRFKIRSKTIEMKNKKIEIIKYWLQLINVKEVRGFFKFINFYRCFVKGFGQLTISFIKLIKNNKIFK